MPAFTSQPIPNNHLCNYQSILQNGGVDTVPKAHNKPINKPRSVKWSLYVINIMGIRIIRRCMGDFNQTYERAG